MRTAECGVRSADGGRRTADGGMRNADHGVVRDYGASFDNTGRRVRIGWNNDRPWSWTTPWSNEKISSTSRPTQRPRDANGGLTDGGM
jgi:hypothetical protein